MIRWRIRVEALMASLSVMYSTASQHIRRGSCGLDGLARGDEISAQIS